MYDNHSFMRLDDMAADDAINAVRAATISEGGYGFVGAKIKPTKCPTCDQVTKHQQSPKPIQWSPGEEWEPQVRALLALAGGE